MLSSKVTEHPDCYPSEEVIWSRIFWIKGTDRNGLLNGSSSKNQHIQTSTTVAYRNLSMTSGKLFVIVGPIAFKSNVFINCVKMLPPVSLKNTLYDHVKVLYTKILQGMSVLWTNPTEISVYNIHALYITYIFWYGTTKHFMTIWRFILQNI